jgi:hypothetical protein
MSTVDENIEVTVTPKKIKTVPAKVGTVLTEHEFNTIKMMIQSRDVGDHRVAQALLNQCDVQKSIYWIWRLADINASNMVYLRTKASREFEAEANLFNISHKTNTSFALHLVEKNWLTEEIYQYLKPGILDELATRTRENNFYNLSIEIKDKYREFDPESVLTPLFISNE